MFKEIVYGEQQMSSPTGFNMSGLQICSLPVRALIPILYNAHRPLLWPKHIHQFAYAERMQVSL